MLSAYLVRGIYKVVVTRRIEKFKPIKYEDTSGTLYAGDSYIVLKVLARLTLRACA